MLEATLFEILVLIFTTSILLCIIILVIKAVFYYYYLDQAIDLVYDHPILWKKMRLEYLPYNNTDSVINILNMSKWTFNHYFKGLKK